MSRWKPDSAFLSGNEFYFDPGGSTDTEYTLRIPYLEIERYDEKSRTVTILPIPKAGRLQLGKTAELNGFPVILKEVERLADQESGKQKQTVVRLHVDMQYDGKASRSLKTFAVGNIAGGRQSNLFSVRSFLKNGVPTASGAKKAILSHSMKVDEVTGAVEYFDFEVDPHAEKITLMLSRPVVVVRGPWVVNRCLL